MIRVGVAGAGASADGACSLGVVRLIPRNLREERGDSSALELDIGAADGEGIDGIASRLMPAPRKGDEGIAAELKAKSAEKSCNDGDNIQAACNSHGNRVEYLASFLLRGFGAFHYGNAQDGARAECRRRGSELGQWMALSFRSRQYGVQFTRHRASR